MTAWFDNKQVLTVSNFTGREPTNLCKRYERTVKKIDVERPNSVAVYSKFMGSVDEADMLMSLYRSRFRCRKWYHRIAFHLFSLSAVNSWIIYQQLGGNNTLADFLGNICFSLTEGCAEVNNEVVTLQPIHR